MPKMNAELILSEPHTPSALVSSIIRMLQTQTPNYDYANWTFSKTSKLSVSDPGNRVFYNVLLRDSIVGNNSFPFTYNV